MKTNTLVKDSKNPKQSSSKLRAKRRRIQTAEGWRRTTEKICQKRQNPK